MARPSLTARVVMGTLNVNLAYAMYPELPHAAMRLLAGMASRALDHDSPRQPARRYFVHEDERAELMGPSLPAEPPPDDDSPAAHRVRLERAARHRAVRRAIRTLVEAGAIEVVYPARTGRTAVYRLNLDVVPAITGDDQRPPGGGRAVAESRTRGGREPDAHRPP